MFAVFTVFAVFAGFTVFAVLSTQTPSFYLLLCKQSAQHTAGLAQDLAVHRKAHPVCHNCGIRQTGKLGVTLTAEIKGLRLVLLEG